tara:strand:+ start:927 stop:1157 length:231 start_codon:yes stop_codon:yes gene_type:complete
LQFERIVIALERIADQGDQPEPEEQPMPIAHDDSMGTCPQCESCEVKTVGTYPKSIYKCDGCDFMWVNQPDAFFQS